MDMTYLILVGAIALMSFLVSSRLKSKFTHYSKLQLRNGMSGAEIAEKMLADNGSYDVKVISTPGRLTDHYNPTDKTVNLDRKSTRLNSSHVKISYAVFCYKEKI